MCDGFKIWFISKYDTTYNVYYNDETKFFLHNASVYTQKTSSMIALLIGQIIFRVRHPEQAYSMRTNYTVKSNREWNELARKNRIQKKASLKYSVDETREVLETLII